MQTVRQILWVNWKQNGCRAKSWVSFGKIGVNRSEIGAISKIPPNRGIGRHIASRSTQTGAPENRVRISCPHPPSHEWHVWTQSLTHYVHDSRGLTFRKLASCVHFQEPSNIKPFFAFKQVPKYIEDNDKTVKIFGKDLDDDSHYEEFRWRVSKSRNFCDEMLRGESPLRRTPVLAKWNLALTEAFVDLTAKQCLVSTRSPTKDFEIQKQVSEIWIRNPDAWRTEGGRNIILSR